MVSLSLGTTATRAITKVNNYIFHQGLPPLTVGRATLALAVIAVIVGSDQRCVNVHGVRDSFAKAVSGERHGEFN